MIKQKIWTYLVALLILIGILLVVCLTPDAEGQSVNVTSIKTRDSLYNYLDTLKVLYDKIDTTLATIPWATRAADANADSIADKKMTTHNPEDGEVIKYYSTGDSLGWAVDNSGGTTAYDDIADPDGDGSIGFSSHTGTYTSATSGWQGLTISNTVADAATKSSLLKLAYTDNDDGDCYFLTGVQNSAADTTFLVTYNGIYYGTEIADSLLVTKGYGDANWSGGAAIKWLNDSLAAYAKWGIAYDADDSFYVDQTSVTGWGLTVTSNVLEIDSTDLDNTFSMLFGDTYYGQHDFTSGTVLLPSGTVTLNNIGNPTNPTSINCSAHSVTLTSANSGWQGLTLSNTFGTLASSSTLLKLTYTDDGSAYGHFLTCLDNSAADTIFYIDYDGAYKGGRGDGSSELVSISNLTDSLDDYYTTTYIAANYQPLEATLTDIADGTIDENLVNTANPWTIDEVADAFVRNNGDTVTGTHVFAAAFKGTSAEADSEYATINYANGVGGAYDWLDSALANAGYGLKIDGTNDSLEIDSADIVNWALWNEAYDSVDAWANKVNSNYDHSQDNTQAHSDYMRNNGDTATGTYVFPLAYRGASAVIDSLLINVDDLTDSLDGYYTTTYINNTYGSIAGETWTGTHDFGGADDLEIPAVANPTTDAEGQIAWDANDDAIEVYSGDEGESGLIPFYQKLDALIFAPDQVADVIFLFKADALLYPHGIEIDQLSFTLPADAAYGVGFHEWTGADPPVFSAQIDTLSTTASDSYAEDGSPTDGAIAADAYVGVNILSTDVDWVHIQIIYHVTEGN